MDFFDLLGWSSFNPNIYSLLKTIHILGFVSWFAALFYIPRLFIYHTEALERKDEATDILAEQFKIMEQRLYSIIMTPAMMVTLICGIGLTVNYGWEWWKANLWLHWKLLFVLMIIGYHHYCKKIIKSLDQGKMILSSMQLRVFNEVATLLLLLIVLLAVYKHALNAGYALIGILGFGIFLGIGIKWYKKVRDYSDNK